MSEEIKYNGQPVYTGKNAGEINKEEETYFGGKTWDKLDDWEKEQIWQEDANKQQKHKKHMDVGSVTFRQDQVKNLGTKDNVVKVDFKRGRE